MLIKTEGLFRITGNDDSIREFEMHLAQGDFSFFNEVNSAHTVANYWKRLLRELKDPLIPFAFYEDFGKIIKTEDIDQNQGDSVKALTIYQ